jgi:transmembrane sensor
MSMQHSPEFFLAQDSFKNWVLGQNEEDCHYWDTWLKANPDQIEPAMMAARMVTGLPTHAPALSASEIQTEWNKLKFRIDHTTQSTSGRQVWFAQFWRVAAAAIFLIGTGFLGFYISQPEVHSYATDFSSKQTIVLTDGTEITLNANSQLTTRTTWKFAPAREIWLEGEAYFKVKSHPENASLRQFVVHTKDLDVRVIGTQFNVNTRRLKTRVYLDEGKVQLALKAPIPDNTLMMSPGEYVDYSRKDNRKGEVQKKVLPPEVVTSWKAGYFTFDHTPLKDVIEVVESTHGIKIHVSNPALLEETITGKVPSEDINELVRSMTRLFNLSFSQKGDDLYLSEK